MIKAWKNVTESSTDFEIKAKSFAIGKLIKEERKLANLTQEQLAHKIGVKKVLYQELRMVTVIFNYQHYTS